LLGSSAEAAASLASILALASLRLLALLALDLLALALNSFLLLAFALRPFDLLPFDLLAALTFDLFALSTFDGLAFGLLAACLLGGLASLTFDLLALCALCGFALLALCLFALCLLGGLALALCLFALCLFCGLALALCLFALRLFCGLVLLALCLFALCLFCGLALLASGLFALCLFCGLALLAFGLFALCLFCGFALLASGSFTLCLFCGFALLALGLFALFRHGLASITTSRAARGLIGTWSFVTTRSLSASRAAVWRGRGDVGVVRCWWSRGSRLLAPLRTSRAFRRRDHRLCGIGGGIGRFGRRARVAGLIGTWSFATARTGLRFCGGLDLSAVAFKGFLTTLLKTAAATKFADGVFRAGCPAAPFLLEAFAGLAINRAVALDRDVGQAVANARGAQRIVPVSIDLRCGDRQPVIGHSRVVPAAAASAVVEVEPAEWNVAAGAFTGVAVLGAAIDHDVIVDVDVGDVDGGAE